MTGTLKLFKRTQSEIEDGEPTTKAAAASVTTPETAYNAVPYSPRKPDFPQDIHYVVLLSALKVTKLI